MRFPFQVTRYGVAKATAREREMAQLSLCDVHCYYYINDVCHTKRCKNMCNILWPQSKPHTRRHYAIAITLYL